MMLSSLRQKHDSQNGLFAEVATMSSWRIVFGGQAPIKGYCLPETNNPMVRVSSGGPI